ncbi:MAG: thermonuclease family protein [Sneathiellaceae bacterium]
MAPACSAWSASRIEAERKIEAGGKGSCLLDLQEAEPLVIGGRGSGLLDAVMEGRPAVCGQVSLAPAIVGVDRRAEAMPRHRDVYGVPMGPGDQGPAGSRSAACSARSVHSENMGGECRTAPAWPILVLIVILWSFPAGAARDRPVLAGRASVIDGDTLEIHGERIRLSGIDAPEASQQCQTAAGAAWPCGRRAAQALDARIGSRVVSCQTQSRDRYGRFIATCHLETVDLGAWLVRNGWALAYRRYSTDYVDEEHAARVDRAGIWAGAFVAPWVYRASRR